jgi:hypothetical protein
MACECIPKIEQDLCTVANEDKRFKAKVVKADLQGVGFRLVGNQLVTVTYNPLHVHLEGKKKPVTMVMHHTFCPWCGTKIIADTAKTESA